jgi:uncharacterized protein DUF3891
MILYPTDAPFAAPVSAPEPVWQAIERQQSAPFSSWWLVTQPDHAALSGDLAAQFRSPKFPSLDHDVVEGIALHDEGWAIFDGGGRSAPPVSKPRLDDSGRPLSFFQVRPTDFVPVWGESIAAAERESPIAGILVSWHFTRIAEMRPAAQPHEQGLISDFLRREESRRARLMPLQGRSVQEIELLVDVLQFCDLLSLYLCAGVREAVELPQNFAGKQVVLRREGDLCCLEPSPFVEELALTVPARGWPSAARQDLKFRMR